MSPPPTEATATYLYCLVRHRQPTGLPEPPPGLPEMGPTRLLDAGEDLWVVAATAPLPEYSAESLEARLADLSWLSAAAVAHERVVESFLDAEGLIPIKLLTLFRSDELALAHVREHRQRLERTLSRVSGHREWGLRLRLRADLVAAATRSGEAGRPATGREFLARKSHQRQASRELAREARERADDAWRELESLAAAAQRHPPPAPGLESRMLLEGAFLVPSSGFEPFEAMVARWAERLAQSGCELTLTGPWPPYNFVGEGSS